MVSENKICLQGNQIPRTVLQCKMNLLDGNMQNGHAEVSQGKRHLRRYYLYMMANLGVLQSVTKAELRHISNGERHVIDNIAVELLRA